MVSELIDSVLLAVTERSKKSILFEKKNRRD